MRYNISCVSRNVVSIGVMLLMVCLVMSGIVYILKSKQAFDFNISVDVDQNGPKAQSILEGYSGIHFPVELLSRVYACGHSAVDGSVSYWLRVDFQAEKSEELLRAIKHGLEIDDDFDSWYSKNVIVGRDPGVDWWSIERDQISVAFHGEKPPYSMDIAFKEGSMEVSSVYVVGVKMQ